MKNRLVLASLLALSILGGSVCLPGCGAVAGTILDTTFDVVTYPCKEYIFWGAFKYDNTWDERYEALHQESDKGDVLLGICISGGGSRSAYFMACVLDQLSKIPVEEGSEHSILDEIDYISSVSGGSLASAYYCLKRGNTPDQPLDEFFAQYKEDMSKNFELRSLLRMMAGYWVLDLFTYYDRADLIASVWDSNFFDGATFKDLAEAQANGAPVLIVNGTSLSNGLKFVFSTIPDDQFRSAYFDGLSDDQLIRFGAAEGYQAFATMGFQSLNSDISQYRLSKAVAASASVPNLLGPVTVRANESQPGLVKVEKGQLVNISDGGIYDNYGLESLVQAMTGQLDKHPGKKARILVIDGSGYFNVEADESADQQSVAYYSERTLSISWLRTKSYMEYVFQQTRAFETKEGKRPYANLDFDLISLYEVLPSQKREDYLIDVKGKAAKKLLRPDVTAKQFLKKITTIQTRFTVSSTDAETIEKVATDNVTTLHPEVKLVPAAGKTTADTLLDDNEAVPVTGQE